MNKVIFWILPKCPDCGGLEYWRPILIRISAHLARSGVKTSDQVSRFNAGLHVLILRN
jgi:hypothetical protein